MKNLILILMLIPFVSSAQSYNHEQLSRALKLRDIPKKISEYTASNGQVFKVGETFKIGEAFKRDIQKSCQALWRVMSDMPSRCLLASLASILSG